MEVEKFQPNPYYKITLTWQEMSSLRDGNIHTIEQLRSLAKRMVGDPID